MVQLVQRAKAAEQLFLGKTMNAKINNWYISENGFHIYYIYAEHNVNGERSYDIISFEYGTSMRKMSVFANWHCGHTLFRYGITPETKITNVMKVMKDFAEIFKK